MSHVLMSVIDVHVYHHYQQYSIYIMPTTDFLGEEIPKWHIKPLP